MSHPLPSWIALFAEPDCDALRPPAGAVQLSYDVEVDGEVRRFDRPCVLARGPEPLSWIARPWLSLLVLTFKAASEEADAALQGAMDAALVGGDVVSLNDD